MARSLHVALISLYALENNGVRHVATALRQDGFRVTEVYFKDWVNNRFPWPTEEEVQDLIGLLRRRNADVVAFSVRASAFHRIARHLTDRVRHALGTPIVWGGMHPTFVPDRAIQVADYAAVGEVDLAAVDFFRCLDEDRSPRECRGFWTRSGQKVWKNDLAPLVDLDALPFRDFHSQDDKFHVEGGRVRGGDPFLHNPEYTTLASRGCPYWTCTFCSNTVTKPLYEGLGKSFRVRSVEHLVREMEYVRGLCRDIQVVRFDDEVFPFKRAWLEELRDVWPRRVGLPFEVLVDPRMVADEPMGLLADAGLRAVCMGVQANERVNKVLYNRDTTNQQVVEAQRVFRRHGIRGAMQIIWDDPESTEADKDELFRTFMSLDRPFDVYLFGLTVYPGTHLARKLVREGRIGEDEVEGVGTHAFDQFRVDLGYPRSNEDRRWLALFVLCNKPFVRKEWVWALYRAERFRRDPGPLVALAQAANAAHMATVVAGLVRRGELTPLLVRRWLNPSSPVTM